MIRLGVLVALLCSCSVLYDTDDLEICAELPEYPEPPCADGVLGCLSICDDRPDIDCNACYDANGNGEIEEAEVRCFECGLNNFYRCFAENGCGREVEAGFCCSEALCGALGCPEMDNPCESESNALNECITNLPDPTICNASGLPCFPR